MEIIITMNLREEGSSVNYFNVFGIYLI